MRPETRFHPVALVVAVRGLWRAVFRRNALERDLDDEMRFHLDMETRQNLRAGMSQAEARRAALIAFGGTTQIAEAHRDARGTRVVDDAVMDLRYATRSLARAPGFVLVSALTLAIPIAIGTVLVTAVNGFFFNPLPVPGGADLVAVFTSDYDGRAKRGASSYPDLLDFSAEVAPVAQLAGETRVMLGIGTGDNTRMAQGAVVTSGYFRLLRVTPALGHFPGDASPEFPTIVLGHRLWRTAFGADSALIGSPVRVNGQAFTVAAVATPAFRGTSREVADEFWIDGTFAPLVMPHDDILHERGSRRFHVLARLREGASPGALDARLAVVAARLFQTEPAAWTDAAGEGRVVTTSLERAAHLAGIPRGTVLLMTGGVVLLGLGLLAVACANLASMQLARGASRRREIATRLALGAGRGRLVRQLLAECALVAVPGTLAGVVMAVLASGIVSHYRPIPLPSIDLSLDWRATAFIAAGLLLALLVFGLMPALQTVRADLVTDLHGGAWHGAGGVRLGRLRGGLIVAQVALTVVFTATAGMIAFGLFRAVHRGRGEARNVLVAQVNFLPAAGDSIQVGALTDQLVATIEAIPGVEGASAAAFIPVRGRRRTVRAALPDGGPTRDLELDANSVGPGYFGVLGLTMLRGRDFARHDAVSATGTVIVSRAMAGALWPAGDPIGRHLTIETRRGTSVAPEVIGVVADPVGFEPATAASFPGLLYLPMRPDAEADMVLHIRAPRGQAAIAGEVMRRLRAEHARLAAPEVMTLDAYYDWTVFPQRLLAKASTGLAGLQLLLALGGLSGLVGFVTALRRREIGIRTALGATRRNVLGLVMRQGIRLAAIGATLGIGVSVLVSQGVAASLPVTVPLVLAATLGAAALVAATSGIAMLLPARRALMVEPAMALRKVD